MTCRGCKARFAHALKGGRCKGCRAFRKVGRRATGETL
jgi:hypothetical protein